jgi:hypothetical protein
VVFLGPPGTGKTHCETGFRRFNQDTDQAGCR